MGKTLKLTSLVMSSILLAGCTLTAPYTRPALPNGPTWSAAGDTSPQATHDWWKSFGDRNLDILVASVLQNNNDILAAAARARKAMIQAEMAGVAMYPRLNGAGNGQSVMDLPNRTSASSFDFAVGASFELDLWGKLTSEKSIAALQAAAAMEDIEAARTTVIATTIETYWRLGFANQDLSIVRQSLRAAKTAEELVVSQAAAGAATELELAEVRQTVEEQAAQIADLEQTRVTIRNALSVLLNGLPNPVAEPGALPGRTPVIVSAGLPATLLSRRPDLRAAEFRLRSTLSGVDVAKAGLYPQLTLTGNLGSTSDQLFKVLANPILTLGAGITLPFLDFANAQLRVKASEADYELAVIEFRSTLLSAFGDTANALSARTAFNEKARRLSAAREAAEVAERLTHERYLAGATTLRVWLDAQERLRIANRAFVANRLDQLVTEVQIFRVLGGSPMDAKPGVS